MLVNEVPTHKALILLLPSSSFWAQQRDRQQKWKPDCKKMNVLTSLPACVSASAVQ